jgi:TusE/DsrC/DsvC family sulfur relay protein
MGTTAVLHDQTAPWTASEPGPDLALVHEKLDRIADAVAAMDERRRELEELVTDLMPAVNGAMTIAIRRLDELERNGTLDFARNAVRALDRMVQTVDPDALQRLAANADALVHLAELATAPELTHALEGTINALHDADKGRPPKLRQLVRATRAPRVRRGLAATLSILRAIGGGTRGGGSVRVNAPPPKTRRADSTTFAAPATPAASRTAAASPIATAPAAAGSRIVAGTPVLFDAEGFMADREAWTPEIATAIAAENDIPELTEAHWKVIDFCREDASATGVAPGMRRITTSLGIPPREMYSLFPGGPGMLAARIAGLPKPRSCV